MPYDATVSTTRPPRDREPLSRKLIVETAQAMLADHEVDEISLRGLARKLKVTAPALYAHVDDKRDLLSAIAEAGYRRLIAQYGDIIDPNPVDALLEACRRYVHLALEDPGTFKVMFAFRSQEEHFEGAAAELQAASAAIEYPMQLVQIAQDQGLIRRDRAADLVAMALWTATHGVATVLLLGLGGAEEVDDLVASVVGTMLAGLQPAT